MYKMALHETFGYLQHQLWAKEWPRVKLAVWLPTTKSKESTQPRCVKVKCNTPLESSEGELQVCFRPHPNRRFEQKVMTLQSPRSPNRDSFRTPLWESWVRKPFGCGCDRVMQRIVYGEGGGFPQMWVVVSLVSLELPMACPNTKSALESDLTNLLVGLMQVRVSKWSLSLALVPSWSLSTPLYPFQCWELGACPQVPTIPLFQKPRPILGLAWD